MATMSVTSGQQQLTTAQAPAPVIRFSKDQLRLLAERLAPDEQLEIQGDPAAGGGFYQDNKTAIWIGGGLAAALGLYYFTR
jgi:hypothetical protein